MISNSRWYYLAGIVGQLNRKIYYIDSRHNVESSGTPGFTVKQNVEDLKVVLTWDLPDMDLPLIHNQL